MSLSNRKRLVQAKKLELKQLFILFGFLFLVTMNYSYWEHKHWLSNIDYLIIGSGIVGLNCALQLRKKHPKAKIVIL